MGTTRYINANGRTICQTKNGVYTRFVHNPQGSVVATVNSSGALSNLTTYWPYGEVMSGGVSSVTNLGYLGGLGYYTDTSGRIYVRARVYRQTLGRWMTVDPLWPSESAYGYVNGRPLDWSDPSGMRVQLCKGQIGPIPGVADHWLLIIDSAFCKNRVEYSFNGVLIDGCTVPPSPGCKRVTEPGDSDRCTDIFLTSEQEKCLCRNVGNLINIGPVTPGDAWLPGPHPIGLGPPLGTNQWPRYSFATHNCQNFVNSMLQGCGARPYMPDIWKICPLCWQLTHLYSQPPIRLPYENPTPIPAVGYGGIRLGNVIYE
jgi:RHS repeat-associated protein